MQVNNHKKKACFNLMTKHKSIDFERLKNDIQRSSRSFLRQLLPNGRWSGHEYIALNPTRNDRNLGSFRINFRTGQWIDFATGDKGGDVISLFAYIKGMKQIEAAKELKKLVGGAS